MTKSRLAHGGGLQEGGHSRGPARTRGRGYKAGRALQPQSNCQMKVITGQARAGPAGSPPRWPAPRNVKGDKLCVRVCVCVRWNRG